MSIIAINEASIYIDDTQIKLLGEKGYTTQYLNIKQLSEYEPSKIELLILDIDTLSLRELYRYIRLGQKKEVATVVCTEDPNHVELPLLFRYELKGYILKESNKKLFIQRLQQLTCENNYMDEGLLPALFKDYLRITKHSIERPPHLLTEREWEVLELIVEGKTTADMSYELSISTKTVTNHVASILQKLQVEDRIKAALLAVKNKWIIL